MISVDTSVVVRYFVGTPAKQARAAAVLIDDDSAEIGFSVVALVETAHVLRSQYEVAQADIIEALIAFIQRENVRLLDGRADAVVETLVRARSMPGRPIPDALIVAASVVASARPLATFDRELRRYGIDVRDP